MANHVTWASIRREARSVEAYTATELLLGNLINASRQQLGDNPAEQAAALQQQVANLTNQWNEFDGPIIGLPDLWANLQQATTDLAALQAQINTLNGYEEELAYIINRRQTFWNRAHELVQEYNPLETLTVMETADVFCLRVFMTIENNNVPLRFTFSTTSEASNDMGAQMMLRRLLNQSNIQDLVHGRVYFFHGDGTIQIQGPEV